MWKHLRTSDFHLAFVINILTLQTNIDHNNHIFTFNLATILSLKMYCSFM
jgi:hypothetical protein